MKSITLFLLLFVTYELFAQNYRAIYNFEYKRDSLSEDKINTNMILDIQKNDTKFYFQKLLVFDSLKRKNIDVSFSSPLQQIVKRKTNSFNNQNFVSIDDKYFTFFSDDKIEWNISDSIKYYEKYKIQKATANWGNRKWIAWFCNEIPVSEGPYKFTGLPGLIIGLKDSKNNFEYKLISLNKVNKNYDTRNVVESNLGIIPIPINLKKYQRILLDTYNNPFSEYKNMKKGTWVLELFDKKITDLEGLKNITKEYQIDIKKNYNPIELDKAVGYK